MTLNISHEAYSITSRGRWLSFSHAGGESSPTLYRPLESKSASSANVYSLPLHRPHFSHLSLRQLIESRLTIILILSSECLRMSSKRRVRYAPNAIIRSMAILGWRPLSPERFITSLIKAISSSGRNSSMSDKMLSSMAWLRLRHIVGSPSQGHVALICIVYSESKNTRADTLLPTPLANVYFQPYSSADLLSMAYTPFSIFSTRCMSLASDSSPNNVTRLQSP